MKVAAVLVLLTLCSIAAANLFTQRHRRQNPVCFDEACANFTEYLFQNVPECNSTDNAVFCNGCVSLKCQFYAENDYELQCIDNFALACAVGSDNPSEGTVPDACVVQPGRNCNDGGFFQFITTLPTGCFFNQSTFCSDDCIGETCNYYYNNNYPDAANCTMPFAEECNATVGIIPVGCGARETSTGGTSTGGTSTSGALGQLTVKGVFPVIVLIAAFLVF